MAKYELKTKKNDASVEDFLNAVTDEKKRNDSFKILAMMKKASKAKPKMWGGSIIGFGEKHYVYPSGQEGDWPVIAFSPRKQNLTLYILCGRDWEKGLLAKLGKHKTGKSCLYINKLEDVDLKVLEKLVVKAAKRIT
ncbi:MAG: DUF1801 domain-containing protein [Ignavibacteria bacterium]|nr:DUF1801 domain-containing protein [Ignavibacteria bacterium]